MQRAPQRQPQMNGGGRVSGANGHPNGQNGVARPQSSFVKKQEGLSSIFQIDVVPGSKCYQYDVDVRSLVPSKHGSPKERMLTRGADDGLRALNRDICYELFYIAYSTTNAFGTGSDSELEAVYNCKATLFTSRPIDAQLLSIHLVTQVPSGDDLEKSYSYLREHYSKDTSFHVAIKPSETGHILALDDLGQYERAAAGNGPLLEEDHSLRTFMELATGQLAFNHQTYVPIGKSAYYLVGEEHQQFIGRGLILRSGVKKGVKVVKGKGKDAKPKLALVLDAKVSPFFAPQCLLDTVRELTSTNGNGNGRQFNGGGNNGGGNGGLENMSDRQWEEAVRMLRDIRLSTNYRGTKSSLGFGGFTVKPLSQLSITQTGPDGRPTSLTIPQYYQQKYGIQLRYPHLRGVFAAGPYSGGSENRPIYPIELLHVMQDQRVAQEKMDPTLIDCVLKKSAVPPEERMAKILEHADRMCLFGQGKDKKNELLDAFGVRVVKESNNIIIGVRQLPGLKFKDSRTNTMVVVKPTVDRANWARDSSRLQYTDASQLNNWIVVYPERDQALVRDFVTQLLAAATRRGMGNGQSPAYHPLSNGRFSERDFQTALQQYPKAGFLLLVSPKRDDSHGLLKYLEAESKQVVTQQLSLEKVRDVVERRQGQTLDNMLNKINVKNHGLNYMPAVEAAASKMELSQNEILVIAYDVAHPAPATAMERRLMRVRQITAESMDPSVVGIVANMVENPHAFVGDYLFQESRREAVDMQQLTLRTKWILETTAKHRPAAAKPKLIVILRDGISEGQYGMALNDELRAIEEGCHQYDASFQPKFLFVVGTKRHFKRFFALGEGGKVENLKPGSVIQPEGVSRTDCKETYIQAHYPLQGTGKAVEYVVLRNDRNVSDDQLQGFLLALCFSHQIIMSAISLPAPIRQADELAKRGMNNYKVMKQLGKVPRLPSGLVDYAAVTEQLSYIGSSQCHSRFTA